MESFDVSINKFEYIVQRKYSPLSNYAVFGKTMYRLVFIFSGTAEFLYDAFKENTKPNDILLLLPDNNYRVSVNEGDNYQFLTICFEADGELMKKIGPINKINNARYAPAFDELYSLYVLNKPNWKLYAKSLIYSCLAELFKDFKTDDFSIDPIIFAESYIHHNYMNKVTLDTLAKITNYSVSHFKDKFKQKNGVSAIKYLNDFRLKKAKEFLATGLYSVSETANLCGFENVYYFSNCFKKSFHISPLNYQKSKIALGADSQIL